MVIKTVAELANLYSAGVLNKEDGDMIIFDKGRCELFTDKDYVFSMTYGEIAWILLSSYNDIYISE